jgi:hypothetical protein
MTRIIISRSDLERMSHTSVDKGRVIDCREVDQKLHQVSQMRSSLWSDSTKSRSDSHLRERDKRLADREQVQRELDTEELTRRQQSNEKLLRAANEQILKRSDQVRKFSKAMIISDVEEELSQQVISKDRLRKCDEERDQEYSRFLARKVRSETAQELEKCEQARQKLRELSAAQLAQIEEQKARWLKQKRDDMLAGEILRMSDREALLSHNACLARKRNSELAAQRETMAVQEYLQEVKRKEKELEEQEDQAIEALALKREDLERKRRDREREIYSNKQRIRETLIEKQAAELEARRDRSDDRIVQQAQEVQDNQNRVEQERERRTLAWKRDLLDARRRQESERRERIQIEAEEERLAAQLIKDNLTRVDLEENEARATKRLAAITLRDELLSQIKQKQAVKQLEAQHKHTLISTANRVSRDYQSELDDYMFRILEKYANEGRNVAPLVAAMASSKTE